MGGIIRGVQVHRDIHKNLPRQDTNLKPRDALTQVVKETKKSWKKSENMTLSKINLSLQDVIKKTKETFPDLYKKKE